MDKHSEKILTELSSGERETHAAAAANAQQQGVTDHWTTAILLERAAYLGKLARHGDGSASETLKEYPRHCAMLSFRSRDGMAEVHAKFADIFYVLDGCGTLVTGGTVSGAKEEAPGEIRGIALLGGRAQRLGVGDVAHVPAGTPHQMLVADENTITCLVFKVEEEG